MSGLSFRRRVGLCAAGALLLALVVPVTEAMAATSPTTVTVPATQPWTDTGISLPAGTVSFKASGTINVSSGDPQFDETPNGDGPADPTCIAGPNEYSGSWTAPGLPCWSLIGRIGNGAPFFVGDSKQVVIKTPGELYLGVNDETDFFSDNSGSWTVQVTWTSSSQSCTYTPAVAFSPNSGPVGTPFTITGAHWAPGGTVTSTLPYGSPGWFIGYQTPTVNTNGGFSFKETIGTSPKGPTPTGTYTFTYVEKYGGCSLSFPQTFTVTAGNYLCSCVTYVRDVLSAQGYNLPGGPEYADGYTPQFMHNAGWKQVNPANGTIPSAGLPMVMVFSAGAKDSDPVAGHMALVANSWAVHAGLAYSGQDPSYSGTSWTITVLHVDWAGDCSPAQRTFTGPKWSNLDGVNFYVPS